MSKVVHGGYTAAGIGMRNLGYGTISITGVPAGATVVSATLLWDVLVDQRDPTLAQGTFDGHAITGTPWASGASPCWPPSTNWAYEANVTSLVAGNGSYSLAGFASGQSDGADPWTASNPPLAEGASLVVIYQLASMPQAVIQIAEGATETDSGYGATATIGGFTASSPVTTTTYIVADGQETGNVATFNGATLPNVDFPGADPQAVANYPQGNLWDTVTTDVSSSVEPGDTSADLGVAGYDDCLVWVGQVLAVTGQRLRSLVAMGDSYSAGEANPPFDAGTAVLGFDTCHRSAKGWPRLLATSDPTIAMQLHIACSGAKTGAITSQSFKYEPPQIEQLLALPQQPQLITITIGGNDAGFPSVVRNCFMFDCWLDHRLTTARNYIVNTLPGVLGSTYDAIRAAEPGSRIVVVGYPRLFPTTQSATHHCGWLTPTERTKLNDLGTLLNSVIGTAAHKAGFTYISTLNALSGHEECQANSWLYPIGDLPWAYNAHPVAAGQRALEAVVRKALG